MRKTLLIASCAMMLLPAFTQAQNIVTRKCGLDAVREKMAQQNPQLLQSIQQVQANLDNQSTPSGTANKTTGVGVIPVVFHICLTQTQFNRIGGNSGIAQRVDSQMTVLNRDFGGRNADSTMIPTVFKPLFAHTGIQFGLAHTNPGGHGTGGYEVKIIGTDTVFDVSSGSSGSGFACSDAKYNSSKGLSGWDNTKYLNIWVCDITDAGQQGILGITTPPSFTSGGFPAAEEGIVLSYLAFGKRKSAFDYYFSGIDKGRTLTHEMGHFFELNHIWGNTSPGVSPSCNDDDGIGDTPKQSDANFGCPTYPKTNCTNSTGGEMFMNYLDYSDDACMMMFSQGQATKMNQQVATGGESVSLTQHPGLTQWPTAIAEVAAKNEFSVSPNPASGSVNISFAQVPATLKDIRVMNMMGQQVKTAAISGSNTSYNVDLSGISKGIYFVQCIFAEEMISRKIVVE